MTISYHDEADSNCGIEEPNRKVKRTAQYSVAHTSSELANHKGYADDTYLKKETKVKFKSQDMARLLNNQKSDQDLNLKPAIESSERDTRPTNSSGNAIYRSGNNRTGHIQNRQIIQEDSN